MQFEIEKNTVTKETVTVKAPAYYSYCLAFYYLTSEFVVVVSKLDVAIYEVGNHMFGVSIRNLAQYGKPLSKDIFETEFNNQLKCLTEQYQSSTNMNLYTDPNDLQKQSEAANAEAPEQAGTDTQAATEETKQAAEGEGALVD